MKKLLFYLLTTAIMLATLELYAFVITRLVDKENLFDHRDRVWAGLNEGDLARFSKNAADPVLGWHSHGPSVTAHLNCRGTRFVSSYDAAGARLYSGFDPAAVKIIAVGDSYTNGYEVDDDDTYPARLSALLGISVANHGVCGYGPTQSVLNFKKNAARYPHAEIVVLGIMYENLYRMLNSYQPVLYSSSSNYLLKPYMAGGRLIPNPGIGAYSNINRFRQAAEKAFDDDFWAKPRAGFPYLVSLGKSLSSNYFYYQKLQKALRILGVPEYLLMFESEAVQLNLVSLLNQYAQLAKELGLRPIVIFIPNNRRDTASAAKFIDRRRPEIDSDLLMGDVGRFSDIDWLKFNLEQEGGDDICHPSPYGYQMIADYIAGFLRAHNVFSVARGGISLSHR